MITYEGNKEFAKKTKRVLKKDWNIDSKIIYGFKVGELYEGKPLKKNEVLMAGFKEYMLPKMKQDTLYLEDDVRFTEDPMKYFQGYDVVWPVYRKGKLTNKPPHNIITGTQALYLSKKAIDLLKKYINTKRLQHFDTFMSNFINNHPELKFKQLEKPIGYEEDHVSLISKDWNKRVK